RYVTSRCRTSCSPQATRRHVFCASEKEHHSFALSVQGGASSDGSFCCALWLRSSHTRGQAAANHVFAAVSSVMTPVRMRFIPTSSAYGNPGPPALRVDQL